MYVSGKKIAYAGLLAALSAVLITLGAVIETSSLFFIAAASFCVGIAIREWGIGFACGFWTASTLVGVAVCPNKFYCITYAAMGVYLLGSEILWQKIAARPAMKHRKLALWTGKYCVFNGIYVPVLVLIPELLLAKTIEDWLWLAVFLAGQAAVFIFDVAHEYFQRNIWNKMRNKVMR